MNNAEIDLDNIPSFFINEKNQDSFLSINVLKNINIDDEIPVIVERNGSRVEEIESDIHSISSNLSISILFENCDDTQDINPINIKKHLEKVDITTNPISDISDSIDFTIDDSVSVFSDRKYERTIQKVLITIQTLSSMKIPWIHTGVVQVKLF